MSKKRKAPARAAKKDPYSLDHLLTSPKSRLVDGDLHGKLVAFFSDPSNWAEVPDTEKDFIRSLLPPHVELNDDGSIPTSFWKYNPEFRLNCRNLQEDLRTGRMDPAWQQQAAQAMEERAAGHFDDFKEKEFEEYWGQKQKVEWNVLAGHASKVRLEELLKEELFRVGDVWCFDHTFGRGEDAIRVEKECKIVSIDGKSITLAIPPGHLKFARRLERHTPSSDDEVMATCSPAVATESVAVNDAATFMEGVSATNDDTRGKDSPALVAGPDGNAVNSSELCNTDAENTEDVRHDGEESNKKDSSDLHIGSTNEDTNPLPSTAGSEPPFTNTSSPTKSSVLSDLPTISESSPTPMKTTSSDCPDPLSAATEYDIILYTTTGLWDLEKEILKIDGRVKPDSRTASTWRVIRCRRNEQDMGSLFEMRDEYYAYKVAKGNYRVERRSG
ncbi:MAG: hypothetical protein Q9184_006484 [Pyrenodesmia sp. 2 TL-2023]